MREDSPGQGKTLNVMVTNTTPPGVISITYDVISDVMTNVTNTTVPIPVRDEELAQIEIGVQAFIFCLALVGNSCVLLALRYRKKKTSRMHLFIMHLSIADLLVAFCNVLPQLAWDVTYRFKGSDALCRVVKYLQVMVVYLSTYVLVMTAVDRYRAICHPLSNYSWSSKRVHAMIGTAWVLSLLLSIPQLVIFRLTEVSPGVYDCWGHFGETEWVMKAYITCFMLSVYILPFFILVLLYGRISYELLWNLRCKRSGYPDGCALNGKIVYKFNGTGTISIISPNNTNTHEQDLSGSSIYRDREREQQQLQRDPYSKRLHGQNRCQCQCHNNRHGNRHSQLAFPRPHSYRGLSRSKMKTIKLTFVVIVAYLLCWSPFFITQMWWAYDKHAPASSSTFVICLLLASLNSCCNPWIYMAFSTNFIQSVIPCCRTRQRPTPPYHHHRVCSLDGGRAPSSSKSSSKSPTPDENTQNRMEKNLLDSRKHGGTPKLQGGKVSRGGGIGDAPCSKCVNCGAAVAVEYKGGLEVAKQQQPPVTVNSWRWRCNLFPSSCKTRGGLQGGYRNNTPRRQLDMEQCEPLHQIQEEQLLGGNIAGTPSDPARSAENRLTYDGLTQYRSHSLERYLQGKKPRKSLSQPSLFCGKRGNSDEQIEVRCTSV